MVRPEITGTRDLAYSLAHRTWGDLIYTLDLDYVEFKYVNHKAIPVALVETKLMGNYMTEPQKGIYDYMATGLKLPWFFVQYKADMSRLRVRPMNDLARNYLKETTNMNQEQWVHTLKELRK